MLKGIKSCVYKEDMHFLYQWSNRFWRRKIAGRFFCVGPSVDWKYGRVNQGGDWRNGGVNQVLLTKRRSDWLDGLGPAWGPTQKIVWVPRRRPANQSDASSAGLDLPLHFSSHPLDLPARISNRRRDPHKKIGPQFCASKIDSIIDIENTYSLYIHKI